MHEMIDRRIRVEPKFHRIMHSAWCIGGNNDEQDLIFPSHHYGCLKAAKTKRGRNAFAIYTAVRFKAAALPLVDRRRDHEWSFQGNDFYWSARPSSLFEYSTLPRSTPSSFRYCSAFPRSFIENRTVTRDSRFRQSIRSMAKEHDSTWLDYIPKTNELEH